MHWVNAKRCLVLLPLALAFACEPPSAVGPASAPQTSRMQISRDGKTLYVALADHDLVRAVDAATGKKVGEVAVPGYPHRLTVLHDGRVAVSARYAGTVSIVDVEKGKVDASVDVGADPFGLVEDDGFLVVAVAGEGDLARIDLKDPSRVADRIALAHAEPRGLAVLASGKLVVTHEEAGALSVVEDGRVAGDIDMRLPSKAFFAPNQMESVTASVDGSELAVPHVECNNDPAQFGAGGTNLTGAPAVTYYVDGPTGYPAVVPAVSVVDPEVGLVSDENRPLEEADGSVPESAGPAAPVINPLNRSVIGQENINGVTEVAYVDGGNLELLVARGSGNVFVRRPAVKSDQASIVSAVKLAEGVESIQISPDGATAYVYNSFDDTISTFPVPHADDVKSKFSGSDRRGSSNVDPLTGLAVRELSTTKPVSTFTVAAPILPADVREGRKLFYGADDRLTHYGAISCQSCHPNGAADGTTWHFAEGPRNSPPLWGGITGTEPFHWDRSVPNLAGISDATIVARMGGQGLPKDKMDAIGAFLDSIPVPAAPRMADRASVDRGAALFASAETGCTACHTGPEFRDRLAHDVGTGRGEPGGTTSFATPRLRGLAYSAPYLHDGSAATLRDVVDRLVATDMMGHGSQLTDDDKDDLVAYLKTL